MKKTPVIAAQLYTLRDFMRVPADMATTLKRVKKLGYDAAQVSGVGPIDPADLRKLMLDAGVTPIGAHVGLDKFRADLKGVAAYCHALGISYVAIPWLDSKACKTTADWKKLFREFEGFATKLAKEGIRVQYHNHMFEFEQFGVKNGKGGTTLLEMLYAGTKTLQSELDFGWVARGGHSPAKWALRMAGRADQVHLKDWSIVNGDEIVWRAVGEGGIDWPEVFKACRKAGTKYYIVEQDSCPITGDPFKSLAISRANLGKMGLG
ncbi:MAG: sugar phosphate isomerase/epimerase family protein [Kiritimatiellia bacterium]|jgi:sugar phosphate isomerase/epimerase